MSVSAERAGSSRRVEYRQLPQRAERTLREETDQGRLSNREKIAIGCFAAFGLVVNHTFFTFNRCVDTNNPLMDIKDPQVFIDLESKGYVQQQTAGGYIPTDKLVQAINKDKNITEFLEKQGINTQEGFTSEDCQYSLLEVLADILTGHGEITCPLYRAKTHMDTTCRLYWQHYGEQKVEAKNQTKNTEFLEKAPDVPSAE